MPYDDLFSPKVSPPSPKRSRGRPPKEADPGAPDPRDFDAIAKGIRIHATRSSWDLQKARTAAIKTAGEDAGLSARAHRLYAELVESTNSETGVAHCKARSALGHIGSPRTVSRLGSELVTRGYGTRKRISRGGHWDPWLWTLPGLLNELDRLLEESGLPKKSPLDSLGVSEKHSGLPPVAPLPEGGGGLEERERCEARSEDLLAKAEAETNGVLTEDVVRALKCVVRNRPLGPVLAILIPRLKTELDAGVEVLNLRRALLDALMSAESAAINPGKEVSYVMKVMRNELQSQRSAAHTAKAEEVCRELELDTLKAKANAEKAIQARRLVAFDSAAEKNRAARSSAERKGQSDASSRKMLGKDGLFNPNYLIQFGPGAVVRGDEANELLKRAGLSAAQASETVRDAKATFAARRNTPDATGKTPVMNDADAYAILEDKLGLGLKYPKAKLRKYFWKGKEAHYRQVPPDTWRKYIENYATAPAWPEEYLGPAPGHSECLVPDELVRELRLRERYPVAENDNIAKGASHSSARR